ncbi:MAG TPA: P-II family nitrogen regulator [Candidatus Lokiarchaeia archaeon]|nr:P-II family nitrogen regulator [Candidatus Lokiarchaeia archaeon]
MKQITAIIRPEKFQDVKKAMTDAGVKGMTITEVKGRGNQKGIKLQSRGGSYEIEFLEKIQIMTVVHDEIVDSVVNAIIFSAKTDRGPGDGKIFVSPVDEVIRIRTGEINAGSL